MNADREQPSRLVTRLGWAVSTSHSHTWEVNLGNLRRTAKAVMGGDEADADAEDMSTDSNIASAYPDNAAEDSSDGNFVP